MLWAWFSWPRPRMSRIKPKSKKEIIFQKELSNGDKVEMEKEL